MKFFRYLLVFFLMITLTFSLIFPAAAIESPEIQAGAALLYETGSGTVLYGQNEEERVYPASTTKIMTIYLAAEAIEKDLVSPDDMITITEDMFYDQTNDGSSASLLVGEDLSLWDLMHCAALISANDACNAIAKMVSGDIDTFIELMNIRATDFGCENTNFVNTHGLHNEDHYTTAKDLARIFTKAMENETFAEIMSTRSYVVPATELSMSRHLNTTNALINASSDYYYKYCMGGKTGYTEEAGQCLVSMAKANGIQLVSIVMNAEAGKLNDKKYTASDMRFYYARTLYEWGFDGFSFQPLLESSHLITTVPVLMGEGTDSIMLRPENSVEALVPNDINVDDIEFDITIYSEEKGETLMAPIARGKELGEVSVYYNNTYYGTEKLIANNNISLRKTEFMKNHLHEAMDSKYTTYIILAVVLIFGLYILYLVIYFSRRKKRKAAGLPVSKPKPEKPAAPVDETILLIPFAKKEKAPVVRDLSVAEETTVSNVPTVSAEAPAEENTTVVETAVTESAEPKKNAAFTEKLKNFFHTVSEKLKTAWISVKGFSRKAVIATKEATQKVSSGIKEKQKKASTDSPAEISVKPETEVSDIQEETLVKEKEPVTKE